MSGFGPGKYAAKAVLNWEGVPDSKRSLKQTWVVAVTYLGEDADIESLLLPGYCGGGIWQLDIA